MDEQERNYCILVLLLTRVGLEKMRSFFIKEWNSAGGFVPWTDCPQNGTDLLKKFTPKPYEIIKIKSGDSTTWDLSIFIKALLYSKPPFVPKSNKALSDGLKCLIDTRNTLCHTGSGRIESTKFTKLYADACNALMLVGALQSDFKKVERDVQHPEVLSLIRHCASQDTDVLQGIDTICSKLDDLKKALDDVHQNQQQSQKTQVQLLQGQSGIQKGLEELKQDQQQGQEAIKQGQSGLQQGLEELKQEQQQRQDAIKQGQSGLQQGLEELKQDQQQGQEDIKQGQSGLQQGLEELKQEQQQGQEAIKQGQSDLQQGLEELKQDQQQGQEEILKGIQDLHKPSISSRADVDLYSIKLQEAITMQTDLLPRRIDQSRLPLKTDDIFTNLTVYQGKQKSLQEKAEKSQCARKTVTEITEIFVSGENEEENPKSILVSGEPGIGKTLFSHKIVRDWSTDCISIPNIQFTYLITFRQLVMLGNKELTLRELLNRSPLLNERTMIDEKMMTHIAQHSDQLFIIFDGYDEYKDHNELLGDFEGQFENDTKTKMPVAALISKLIQRKILCDSVIMITSRPGEADELDKKLQFDRCVEITGFSDEQVLQYVEKYFNSKPEEVKKMAMEKVRATAHYMSFGRVPLRCLFVCQVIEYEIQNNITRDNSIPLKVTQFYCEVIRCLERNNREIRSLDEEAMLLAVEKTLDNFSKLAAQLAEQNRFTFSQKDLKKLKLPEVEISYLKSSNLIFCYPVASDSPFPQSTLEYSFSHLTIQEFFVACHLVKKRAMAAQETSEMVHIFTSGLLGLDQENNNDKRMSKVLKSVWKQGMSSWRQRVVLLRCLHEYGQEKEFTRQELTTNRDYRYWNSDVGWIGLLGVTDTDCDALAMLLESTATSISSPPHVLYIAKSPITITMLNRLLSSLHSNSTITGLCLRSCSLNDDHVKCLCNHFNSTDITMLNLCDNNITDVGVHHIVHSNIASKLTYLNLSHNNITDVGVDHIVHSNIASKLTHLDLSINNITDVGVDHIVHSNIASKITFLDLRFNPVSVEVSKSSKQFCQDNYPGLEFYI